MCTPNAAETKEAGSSDIICARTWNMGIGHIHVRLCVTEALSAASITEAVRLLSPDERKRHDRFIFECDRRDFAVAHAVLRRTLSEFRNVAPEAWRFRTDPSGKPLIVDNASASDVCFSLSHTRGLVACAVANGGAVGIDIERLANHSGILELARRFFSHQEYADLEQCEPAERQVRFIEVWTLKEAYVKALGKGLSFPLDEFCFVFDGAASLRFNTNAEITTPWHFALFVPAEDCRMAVAATATESARFSIVARRVNPESDDTSRGCISEIRAGSSLPRGLVVVR